LALESLNDALLWEHNCYFGGGTAIALRHGEYRASVDVNFLVSDLVAFRTMREVVTGKRLTELWSTSPSALFIPRQGIRADQYGIRCTLEVMGTRIKFEIVLEGRIQFEKPSATDAICGVPVLTDKDLAASKLLANSDRWADD